MEGDAVIVLYPEALHQHPGDAIDVLRMFLFSIPIGLIVYSVALLILLLGTLIKRKRRSLDRQTFQVVVRAAIPIGAAFELFMPIMGMSEIAGEAFAFSMAVVTLLLGVIFAWYIIRRSRRLNVPCLFPDSWWVLILTIPLTIAMVASLSSARQNEEIASREMKSEGVIVVCQAFNLCRFTFEFKGRSFEGAGKLATGSATAGHRVEVFFDGNHPQTSSLEDFAATRRRQLGVIPFCLMAICAIVGAAIYAGRRQSRAADHVLSA